MAKSTSKLFKSEVPEEVKEDALNLPETEEKEEAVEEPKEEAKEEVVEKNVSDAPVDDIVDVNISAIKRKRFRVNGDSKKILELNVSDLNVVQRMSVAYDKLQKYMEKVGDILEKLPSSEDATQEQEAEILKKLDDIDQKMRKEVDYIFDYPVSDICADGGSMYDPFDGAFRFEHIIEALAKLYENNLENEFAKMKKRVSAKTSKYTKKYHN